MLSIGAIELAVVIVALGLVLLLGRTAQRRWLFGIPAMFAVAALTTPSDPVSQLLVAVPCSLIYAVALIRQERRFGQAL